MYTHTYEDTGVDIVYSMHTTYIRHNAMDRYLQAYTGMYIYIYMCLCTYT